MPAPLFPVALRLDGRRCAVVGGGAVGRRRAEALLACGAEVLVVDPAPVTVPEGAIHAAEPFAPDQLDGAFLVVAATSDPSVNAAVAQAARARGALVNLAAAGDDAGDCIPMAAVRRGDLLVGVTTGGAGPAVAARLRRELEARFTESWTDYTALLAEVRCRAKASVADPEVRAARLRALAADETVFALLASGDAAAARRRAEEVALCLS